MNISKVELDKDFFLGSVFPPHGSYRSRIEGRFVLTNFEGPFNPEIIPVIRKLMCPLLREASIHGKFVIIGEYSRSIMCSIETIEMVGALMSVVVKQIPQLSGVAHVVNQTVEGRQLMKNVFAEKVYAPLGIPYHMFETFDPAVDWANDLLSQ